MPPNVIQNKVLFKLETDLAAAEKATKRLQRAMQEQKDTEALAKAEGNEHKTAMIKQRIELRKLKEQQKLATKALKRHTKEQEVAAKSSEKVAESTKLMGLAMKALPFVAAAAGFQQILGFGQKLIDQGIEYEGTIKGLEKEITNLRAASGNMITDESLARFAEFGKKLQLTDEQMGVVVKSAIKMSRVAKIDTAQALEMLTDSVTSGSTAALEKMGIQMEEVSGSKTVKMRAILARLSQETDGFAATAENAAEQLAVMNNETDQAEKELGRLIVTSETYNIALKAMHNLWTGSISLLGRIIKDTQETIYLQGEYVDEVKKDIKILLGMKLVEKTTFEQRLKIAQDSIKNEKKVTKAHKKEVEERVIDHSKEIAAAKKKYAALRKAREAYFKSLVFDEKHFNDEAGKTGKALLKEYADKDKKKEQAKKKHLKAIARADMNYMRAKWALEDDDRQKMYEREALEAEQIARKRERLEALTEATLQTVTANIASANSFGEFSEKMMQAGLNSISQLAMKKAGFEVAEGLAALATTWGIPNPASIGHFAAAAGYAALGIGSGVISSQIGSSGGSGEGTSSGGPKAGKQSSSPGVYTPQNNQNNSVQNQGPNQITNVYIKGRDLTTRRDKKRMFKMLKQGRQI